MISIASVLTNGLLGRIIFVCNLLGSTGDLIMSLYLCKYNEGCLIVDKDYGFDIIVAENMLRGNMQER